MSQSTTGTELWTCADNLHFIHIQIVHRSVRVGLVFELLHDQSHQLKVCYNREGRHVRYTSSRAVLQKGGTNLTLTCFKSTHQSERGSDPSWPAWKSALWHHQMWVSTTEIQTVRVREATGLMLAATTAATSGYRADASCYRRRILTVGTLRLYGRADWDKPFL